MLYKCNTDCRKYQHTHMHDVSLSPFVAVCANSLAMKNILYLVGFFKVFTTEKSWMYNPIALQYFLIAPEQDGLAPLHRAATLHRPDVCDVITLLIQELGCHVDCLTRETYETPLHLTVKSANPGKAKEICALLLELGADKDNRDIVCMLAIIISTQYCVDIFFVIAFKEWTKHRHKRHRY